MTYRIVHKTTYKYKVPVSVGNHIAYLTPRTLAHHSCTSHELLVTPSPSGVSERFGHGSIIPRSERGGWPIGSPQQDAEMRQEDLSSESIGYEVVGAALQGFDSIRGI